MFCNIRTIGSLIGFPDFYQFRNNAANGVDVQSDSRDRNNRPVYTDIHYTIYNSIVLNIHRDISFAIYELRDNESNGITIRLYCDNIYGHTINSKYIGEAERCVGKFFQFI